MFLADRGRYWLSFIHQHGTRRCASSSTKPSPTVVRKHFARRWEPKQNDPNAPQRSPAQHLRKVEMMHGTTEHLATLALPSIFYATNFCGQEMTDIKDVKTIASYSFLTPDAQWLDKEGIRVEYPERAICVPGIPPLWRPYNAYPLHFVKQDDRVRVALDYEKWLGPVFKSILTLNPGFDIKDIDLVVDRKLLTALWRFVDSGGPDIRFDVEVIGKTMMLQQWRQPDISRGEGISTYRSAILNSFIPKTEGIAAHHCVMRYDLGGLKCLVKTPCDGYLDYTPLPEERDDHFKALNGDDSSSDSHPKSSADELPKESTSSPIIENPGNDTSSSSSSPPPSQPPKSIPLSTPDLPVLLRGHSYPHTHLIRAKTIPLGTYRTRDFKEVLWLTQASHIFSIRYDSNGSVGFAPKSQTSEEVLWRWVRRPKTQTAIRALVELLRRVRNVVRSQTGEGRVNDFRATVVTDREVGDRRTLEVYGTGRGGFWMPEGVRERLFEEVEREEVVKREVRKREREEEERKKVEEMMERKILGRKKREKEKREKELEMEAGKVDIPIEVISYSEKSYGAGSGA